ncbi:MAG: DUF58 domain-containing protein, partial [Gammaproteobacteria bacterium]|nr:DUF58 domain-containing protein [Gammaproteobacteria bacterium]
TKLFREERERPVFMLVDGSATMHFGTRRTFKSVVAAEAAAILAWAACAGGDRVGGLLFSSSGHREVRPTSGQRGVLQLLKVLVDGTTQTASERSGLAFALNRLRRVARPGSLIFILSDFRQLDEEAERHLVLLSRHNDLLPFFIYDPLEHELPPPGRYNVAGEAGTFAIDTVKRSAREQYRQQFSHRLETLSSLFRKQGVRLAELATDDDVAAVLRLTLAGRT